MMYIYVFIICTVYIFIFPYIMILSDAMIVKAVLIHSKCFQLILNLRVVMSTLLFVLSGSAFSSLKSLEISQLRGGRTVTLAMLTYSSASLKWQLVITSELTSEARGLSQVMVVIVRYIHYHIWTRTNTRGLGWIVDVIDVTDTGKTSAYLIVFNCYMNCC